MEKRKKCGFRWTVLAAVVLMLSLSGAFPVQAEETTTVKAGFFAFDGYHMVDDQGRYSGYGYDYLQYLTRYANFKYEYIGYDKSWSEMQDMLESGEIDLLTSAQKTEEREARFDFSEYPIGNSAAILTVRAGDNRYMTGDYTLLDGMRVGLLRENSRNEGLERFAEEKGFTYRPVYFEDVDELAEALQKGDGIDAALTSNLRKIKNEWIIATFDVTPFYVMVKKGNDRLLDQIDRAIEKVQADDPNLQATLYDRYYSAESGDEIAYTAQEREYIQQRRASGDVVRVTINSGRQPVSYFVDGEARGIIPEIAKLVMHRTGLPYEFVDTPPTMDARELVMRDQVPVRFDGTANFNDAERYGFRVSEPYLQLPLSCVTLKENTEDPKSVAVIRNSDVVEEYVSGRFGEESIYRYDSADECLNAVLTGKQDAAFFQTYIAQRFVYGDVRNRLKEQLVPGYEMNFAIAVGRDDTILFSILNKAVLSLNSDEIDRIVFEETAHLAEERSFLGYLYDHPAVWMALFAAAACFVTILLLYLARRRNLNLERRRAQELERFISYVCRANDYVMELDVDRRLLLSYQVEGGKVLTQEKELKTLELEALGVYSEDRENVVSALSGENVGRLIDTGGETYFECRIRKDGESQYQWYATTVQGVLRSGDDQGRLLILMKNIDHIKKEEEEKRRALEDALVAARQAGEAKGAFMSRMSHEIRTPLNAIIGYLTVARSNLSNTEKAEGCLDKSEYAAHHLLNIINDVLDISAIESGKMKIAHDPFNFEQLVSGITSIFHSQARDKGVDFRVKLNGLTEKTLVGDELRLNQILMNLLSNAVKFTSQGGKVTLTIRQKGVKDGKVYLQIEVADSGIGMTEEFRERLFEPFEQQDASTAQKFGGTGLGLSITRNLVNMMEGAIEVRTKKGEGTRFTVNLPLDAAEEPGEGSAGIYDFSGLRILALYDENSDYRYIHTLLERLGVNYDLVLNVDEGIRKIAERRGNAQEYDLCLLDWDIRDADAGELAGRVRAAGTPEKPVIVAVAYEDPGLKEEQIGGVVLKPVFQSSLFDILSNVCERHLKEQKDKAENIELGLRGMRVLLAEDNAMNMEIAKEILEMYGLVIDEAVNGEAAAKLFEQSAEGTYQAILMDIQMPVMNGYEAARRIRAGSHPQAESIPIIALTADAFTEDVNRALAAGMNCHVSKPIDFEGLCRILSGYMA